MLILNCSFVKELLTVLLNVDTIHDGGNYRVKDKEKAQIFQALCASGTSTRREITVSLGFRPITVSRIVKELIEDRIITEGEPKMRSGKGRPEVELFPNYQRLSAVSLTVVSREIRGFLLNLNGEIISSAFISVPRESANSDIVNKIKGIIMTLLEVLPGDSELAGIGASLPGTVNTGEGQWISSSRWPELNNIPLSAVLSEYGVPVYLYRSLDPELEYQLYKNSDYRKGGTLLFHWGYGIGSAFAWKGKVLKSTLGRFGEVGHWQIVPESKKRCSCGSYGCLETEAALWAVLPELRKAYPEAPEDEPEFTNFIKEKDITGLEVIDNALGYVSLSLGNLYKVFYPDRILLLGPFISNGSILESLKQGFSRSIPEYTRSPIEFTVVDGSGGAAQGSVYYIFRKALKHLLKTRVNV